MAKAKRIAVLGGGVGGCAAAYWLTHPDQGGRYEVTLFQTGWRLGGKGASGRNQSPDGHHCSEEHGLHVWFGFYQTAFRMLHDAYALMGDNGDFTSMFEVFMAQDQGIIAQQQPRDAYDFWVYDFPKGAHEPGDAHPPPDLAAQVVRALEWVDINVGRMRQHFGGGLLGRAVGLGALDELAEKLSRMLADLGSIAGSAIDEAALALAIDLLRALRRLVHIAATCIDILPGRQAEADKLLRMLDLGLTCMIGLHDGGVLRDPKGFDKFDDIEFMQWLEQNGARWHTLASGSIKGLYDLPFAYRNGESGEAGADLAAGVALRAAARIFFGYKGAFVYKMRIGMGEAVFVPMYLALKARGVDFRFFHRVENLGLSADRSALAHIDVAVQARPRDGGYNPLVGVTLPSGKTLRVWPDRPVADRLEHGTRLPGAGEPSFESDWCTVPPVAQQRFTIGPDGDFDAVVMAIPVGAHRQVAGELIEAWPAWREMVEKTRTTRTQCVQLWMHQTMTELGWSAAGSEEHALVDGYVDDFNTWMDQCVILETETWPARDKPGALVYFCGPMADDPHEDRRPDYPARQQQAVAAAFRHWAAQGIAPMWPKALDASGEFDWSRVCGAYYRANIDGSEAYVLSVTGSTRYRLPAEQCGIERLFIAGDWTRNGMNVGCVEAAAISGAMASRAISGIPAVISGEFDF